MLNGIHPHIHLFLPSSDPTIQLEARLYLPLPIHAPLALPITTNIHDPYTNPPLHYDKMGQEVTNTIKGLGVERLVVAAHPWGRLGGNMLDPILLRLVSAVFNPLEVDSQAPTSLPDRSSPPPKTAALTYNVRGVGCSQGSQPWLGVGYDPADFAHIEKLSTEILGSVKEVYRFARLGYSWGSLAVTLAPRSPLLKRIFLVSPPITFFAAITYFSKPNFKTAINNLLDQQIHLKMIYGTRDEFTTASVFHSIGQDTRLLEKCQVDEGDHLYRGDYGEILRKEIEKWLG
nr:hypothetical protein L204_02089 [Cryptococcus depauperatus CBS 7855]